MSLPTKTTGDTRAMRKLIADLLALPVDWGKTRPGTRERIRGSARRLGIAAAPACVRWRALELELDNRGMSVRDAATMLQTTPLVVAKWISGDSKPMVKMRKRVLEELGVPYP
jgi:hypothetical protein